VSLNYYTYRHEPSLQDNPRETPVSEADAKPATRRKRLLNLLLLLILLLLVGCFVALVLVTRRPGFYRRRSERSSEKLLTDAQSFNRKVQYFYGEKSSRRDFVIELTEDEISGYLAAANDDTLWQHLALKLEDMRALFRSTTMRNTQVAFRDGRITVAGETTFAGLQVVLSLVGSPRLDDGRLVLKLECITAGSLPLPPALFGELREKIDDRPFPSKSKKLRIESFEVDGGKLVLHVKSVRKPR